MNSSRENWNYFVLARDVLGLRTNLKHFGWSYGQCPPPAKREEYDACALRTSVRVGQAGEPQSASNPATPPGKYHYFSGIQDEDIIRYRRGFLLGSRLELEARGLVEGEPEITTNSHYQRYITGRFMNLHSPGYILTDITVLALLRLGFVTLHCSAFRVGKATVVVFAAPNTGKTLSTMMACLERGADFLAEDLAISDGKKIFAVPWTSTFRYYSQLEQPFSARLAAWGRKVFPPMELIMSGEHKRISSYIGEDRICPESDITHVVLLGRGKPGVIREDRSEVLRKIINLNRFEFNYVRAPLITVYEYYNPALDVLGNFQKEQTLLEQVVNSAQDCFTVNVEDPTEYTARILEEIG